VSSVGWCHLLLRFAGLTLDQVLEAKAEAKQKLQRTYQLSVGNDYVLLVFIGRITHQKGCDIIAEVCCS
jgi:glycogen synthase